MLQTLQTTALPSEIALLARNLEQQAPGQYRQETLSAVNEVLAMAEKDQLAGSELIDQLLALASRPAAVEALQNARTLLGKRQRN